MFKRLLWMVLVTVLLLALVGFAFQGVQRFKTVITEQLTVSKNAAIQGDLAVTDDVTADTVTAATGATVTSGGMTVTAGGLTLSDGNAVVADFARITAQTAISVTDGSVITPTGSYQPLESAGAVTATMSSGCTAGNQVILVNTVAQAIVISETATSALSGNATLNQYDAMPLLCDGTRWVQTAPESDN